jgi:hypothetical protein
MKNKATLLCTALIGASLLYAPTALAETVTLLRDTSFELQLPPDEGGWTLFEKSVFSRLQARSGNQSMFNGGISRTISYHPYFVGIVSGSFQEFPADEGSRWRLTGFGLAPIALKGTPTFGIVQVSFFDADGNDLGTVETVGDTAARAKTSNEVNRQTPPGEWVFLDTGIATAPAGTAAVQAFTIYVDFSGSNTSQGVYFDDLTLCALDEGDDESSPCGGE